MGYPKLYFDNRFADGTPVAGSTAPGNYAAANISDLRPYTWWKAASLPDAVKVDCGTAKAVDYLCFYGHNLGSKGATIWLQASTDNFMSSFISVGIDQQQITSDVTQIFNITSATYRYWRIVIGGCHNFLKYSGDISNAVWGKANCTCTDGFTVIRSATGNHYVVQGIAMANIQNRCFTFSVDLQAGTLSGQIALFMRDSTGAVNYGFALITPTGTRTRYHITAVFGAAVANDINVYIDPVNDAGAAGDTFFMWDAQLEESPHPSIYIPTAASGVVDAPSIAIAMIGEKLSMPTGVPYGIDPLARKVVAQTNISERGLPLGKNVLFEEFSQQLNFRGVLNSWLRAAWFPAWKTHLRDKPFLLAIDPDNFANEIYLVEATNMQTPSAFALHSNLQLDVKGVAL